MYFLNYFNVQGSDKFFRFSIVWTDMQMCDAFLTTNTRDHCLCRAACSVINLSISNWFFLTPVALSNSLPSSWFPRVYTNQSFKLSAKQHHFIYKLIPFLLCSPLHCRVSKPSLGRSDIQNGRTEGVKLDVKYRELSKKKLIRFKMPIYLSASHLVFPMRSSLLATDNE